MSYSRFEKILKSVPYQIELAGRTKVPRTVDKAESVVLCGMGGSGIPGEIVRSYCDFGSTHVVKDFGFPDGMIWPVGSKKFGVPPLVFVTSYSGNTEEACSCFLRLQETGTPTVVIGSGGKLVDLAKERGVPFVKVEAGYVPRMAYSLLTIPILHVLESVLDPSAGINYVTGLPKWSVLKKELNEERASLQNEARVMAEKIGSRKVFIYASRELWAVGYKWKINLNETSKRLAFLNTLPEAAHNELEALMAAPAKKTAVILLLDSRVDNRVRDQFCVLEDLLKEKGVAVLRPSEPCGMPITRLFRQIWLGDWVSFYLAKNAGVDPEDISAIEGFKKRMHELDA